MHPLVHALRYLLTLKDHIHYYNIGRNVLDEKTCILLRSQAASSDLDLLVEGLPLTARDLFEALLEIYGPQGWWPADSFDELCLGAILVQNTSWNNATMALSNLAEKGLLSLPSVASAQLCRLEEAVYPAGTYRRKAAIIWAFASDFTADFKTAESFRKEEPLSTRKWLLRRKGIGQESADTILCYGAQVPFLVIDRYARRLVKRTGLIDERISSYEAIRECLQNDLPEDAQVLGEFHALVVMHGKSYCGKSPSCEACPLGTRCSFANSGDSSLSRRAMTSPFRETGRFPKRFYLEKDLEEDFLP